MAAIDTLLEAITAENAGQLKQTVTTENVTVENVDILGSLANDINTQATLTAISGKGFDNNVQIAWRRLRLERLFYLIPVTINTSSAKTTVDIAMMVEQLYEIGLTETDIVESTITVDGIASQEIVLYATNDSIQFCGQMTVVVTNT